MFWVIHMTTLGLPSLTCLVEMGEVKGKADIADNPIDIQRVENG